LNNILSYEELDESTKKDLENIKLINGYKQGSYSETHFGKEIDINYNYKPNLVQKNIAGKIGLFFPFLQIHQIDGMDELESKKFIESLRDKILQEKYMYHHDWEDGDVVLSEQWLGIHKRWRFENINNRVVHRICLDFSNCKHVFE
jgi:alpha-ketoglutarate-dependent taurine dioxygenase